MNQLTPPSAPTYPNVGYIGARDYISQNVNQLSNWDKNN